MDAIQHARNFWLPLAIVGGLVILTTWLGQLVQTPLSRTSAAIGHTPEYFAEDFNITAYDVGGEPRYRLNAVHMVHYMDDETTELDAPRFVREGAGISRVVVRSLHGKVSSDGRDVHFIGDVRMLQERGTDAPPLELSTEYLQVLPEADRMLTDRPVLLKEGRSEVRGAGMVADGKQRTLDLQGRVRGIYETHR